MSVSWVAMIGLCQTFLVFASYVFTCGALKVARASRGPDALVPALPEWIRHHGLWLLLVPVIWTILAACFRHGKFENSWTSRTFFVIGAVLAVVLAFVLIAGFIAPLLPTGGSMHS